MSCGGKPSWRPPVGRLLVVGEGKFGVCAAAADDDDDDDDDADPMAARTAIASRNATDIAIFIFVSLRENFFYIFLNICRLNTHRIKEGKRGKGGKKRFVGLLG